MNKREQKLDGASADFRPTESTLSDAERLDYAHEVNQPEQEWREWGADERTSEFDIVPPFQGSQDGPNECVGVDVKSSAPARKGKQRYLLLLFASSLESS